MARRRTIDFARISLMSGLAALACGSSDDSVVPAPGDGASIDGSSSGSGGTGSGSGTSSGTNTASTTSSGAITATPIRGGGDLSAPLGVGCGPETAHECHPAGGDCENSSFDGYQLISAARECFFAVEAEVPTATIEHIVEVKDGQEYVHVRITFNPAFVDTVYGECAAQTGWTEKGHSFKDLRGSDHVELMLFDCADELAMQLKIDFIEEDESSGCGYASGGVVEGSGGVILGDEAHVLAATSSLDRNMNGCGYCEDEESPCTDIYYAVDPTSPHWDFRVSYEAWISTEAFGSAGFCRAHVDSVHASPSKTGDNTVEVVPDDCGEGGSGGGGGTGGGAGAGSCPPGYVNQVDLLSEDILCVPE